MSCGDIRGILELFNVQMHLDFLQIFLKISEFFQFEFNSENIFGSLIVVGSTEV